MAGRMDLTENIGKPGALRDGIRIYSRWTIYFVLGPKRPYRNANRFKKVEVASPPKITMAIGPSISRTLLENEIVAERRSGNS
jgi:hypothetical protein